MTPSIPAELDGGSIDSMPDEQLDSHDRRLISIIQTGFPIAPRPYAILADQVGLTEDEVFARIQALKKRKLIRRLGANFQSKRLGFHSTLCAAKVPQEKMDAFVQEVNRHVGVTHNYLRKHAYNVWFTCIGPSKQAVEDLLASISAQTGIAILNLPAKKMYKIKVDFKID